jgi:fluoroacetyl-CoA thioesterase
VPSPAAGKMALRTAGARVIGGGSLRTIYLVDTIEGIKPGLEGRTERVVEGELLTHHVGGQGTFSTPAMIGLMEITSHRSVERLLPPGHTTVGYEVHVRHLAPTAPGRTIVVTSRLTEVKGNKLYFDLECRDGELLLGSGIHKRAIVQANF